MKKSWWIVVGIVGFLGIPFAFVGLQVLWFAPQWAGRAVPVIQREVDPGVLLKKYEWFKDASAALDKKVADMQVYESRLQVFEGQVMARTDREQRYGWLSELAGVKASYNQLAAEYNANMAKMNYRFTNIGMLPQGATDPLPREYKPYETN